MADSENEILNKIFLDSDLVPSFNELYEKYLNLFPKKETRANKDRVKLTEEQVKEWYDKQELTQLFQKPHPKARKLYNHYSESTPYHTLEIDLLFMPHDNGFKYILSVVDVATRYKWGVALRNKQSDYVLERFKTLKIPFGKVQQISSDAGGEFSSIIKWAEEKNIKYHKAEPSHHLSMVENLNKLLAVKLFQKQTLQELETGKVNKKWVDNLQKVLNKLNNTYNKAIRMKPSEAIKKSYVEQQKNKFNKKDLIRRHDLETRVRRLLNTDEIVDVPTKKISVEKRRATDIKWSLKIYTVKMIIKNPDALYLHRLWNDEKNEWYPHLYTYWQPQPV